MHSKLLEIIEYKNREIQDLKKNSISFSATDIPKRDFKKAISKIGYINLIAEIKFFSPSAGIIREYIDPCIIGKIYEKEGVSAISLLTDKKFFHGNIKWLPLLKENVAIPILRKDFILDPIQIEESKLFGADAILLIVRILSNKRLKELISLAEEMELDVIVEVHDIEDLKRALDVGASIIGINNRDLNSFNVDLKNTLNLLPYIPYEKVIISESGISEAKHIEMLKKYNVNAVLVGTSIMKSIDIKNKLRELTAAAKR